MLNARFKTPIPRARKWYSAFLPRFDAGVVVAVVGIFMSIGIVAAVVGGYIANIVKLVGMEEAAGHMGEFVTRIIGIVIFPLGIIMGLFF